MTLTRSVVYSAVCAAALLFAPVQHAQAASSDAAGKYIESLGDQALKAISDKSLNKKQKQSKLEGLFADNVDFTWVARFVMGRYWRKATEEQKDRYVGEYKKFLLLHYTSRFADYTSGSFKVTNTRDNGDDEYTVSMEMQGGDAGSPPVLVDYHVRAEGSSYKVFDVVVEGVSMIQTQRSEFNSVLSKHDIDYLIAQLTAKSKTGDITLTGANAQH